jgi:hypothetical protein
MHRLLVRRGNIVYRMLGYEFRDHADGSFYIEIKTADREGKPGSREKISYHPTGRIKFSGPLDCVLFGEPIFAFTQLREIGYVSLADLAVLQQATDAEPGDQIFDVPESDKGRINLSFIMGPDDDAYSLEKNVTVTYPGWFRLHLVPGADLPMDPPEDSTHISAAPTLYSHQVISQSQALIFFHQKRTGTKDTIFFWDAQSRVGRLIFAVPMRIPPALEIEFYDLALEAEPQPPVVLNTATAELRFKVRGPEGYLAQMPLFKKLALHAEL